MAEAVAGLVRWYRAQEEWDRLADLHERRAKAEVLDVAQRINHWRELWDLLRSGVTMPDEARERRAREALEKARAARTARIAPKDADDEHLWAQFDERLLTALSW